MSLAQVHYISAAPGDAEKTAGRFTAVGPGVSQALLAEIEPLVGYALPDGASHRPADAELRSLPQAFTYAALSDGSRLVGRTAPARGEGPAPVRFHAHAVHIPSGVPLPGDRLPVEAWRSPHWVSVTPVGGTLPDPLGALPPGPAPVREGLDDFAVSRGPWLAAVLADLRRASEEAPAGGPVVLVERQNADVARWLGLAAVTLPRESVERLTFTTYTRRPGSSALRVVGALPEDAAAAREAGLRVHVCADRPPVDGTPDMWARTAARVWRSRAPELFQEARELPGDPFAAGPLAVIALCNGVALGPEERAAAAGWAAERPYALDAERIGRLVEALASPGIDDRTGSEFDAVGRLFGALDGRCPASVTAPLAAMLVTEAVRGGNGSLELPRRDAFVGPDGEAIAGVLGPEILTELESGAGGARPVARTVQLLRVARLLGVNGTELLPGVVDRLAPALLAEASEEPGPSAFAPALLELLDEQFDVRTALLGALDRTAPEDPGAVARFLERVALPFTGTQALPHLRMCAEVPGAMTTLGRDRTAVWHRVLRAAGLSPSPSRWSCVRRWAWSGRTGRPPWRRPGCCWRRRPRTHIGRRVRGPAWSMRRSAPRRTRRTPPRSPTTCCRPSRRRSAAGSGRRSSSWTSAATCGRGRPSPAGPSRSARSATGPNLSNQQSRKGRSPPWWNACWPRTGRERSCTTSSGATTPN
ncbi:hypothetical protein Smic_66360 [Streptomyces microflavus]|uniref:Uncharacterized protein n=1 Tax=Streptomyces microflavus TaxID=1919 RepID=A0A7J0D011_STRMI|nr:hypothetical protein Smic_66360 [Streptomyces microflavus]